MAVQSVRPAADGRPPLGALLQATGHLTDEALDAALTVQSRSGGRLGEILVASGAVTPAALVGALAAQAGAVVLDVDAEPDPHGLDPAAARRLRAVVLTGRGPAAGDRVEVAVDDAAPDRLNAIALELGASVAPLLCERSVLDELLQRAYGAADAADVTRVLFDHAPELSAYTTGLNRAQAATVGVVGAAVVAGAVAAPATTAIVLVALATAFFVLSSGFRLYAAAQGARPSATIAPSPEALAAIDERTLPVYTVLLPLYKEKPSTVRTLLRSLDRLDYPKHKLEALMLTEDDDDATRAAVEQVGRPPWLQVLTLPPGVPRTKPRAMGIGLRYARGSLVTVFDAEDKPDPLQLKKAAVGFRDGSPRLACLQAKLGYYNSRQNLLTRWFTLEYDAWFNIFLPGLHRIGAPIPLGGTSNHFRRDALDRCRGWDPYNVTEDADLGLRLARLGLETAMLESTTEEEANSQVASWIRQRSRWSKGYMQTVLVHTRRPLRLAREIGPRPAFVFLLTLGGAVLTALLAPIFWALLALWVVAQPQWVADLFPGPVFYAASLCLVLGNFLLVLLSLGAAVARGHDDLAPYALMTPAYWLLMSVASYMALVELFFRPYHWHKTEHGLHLAEEPA
jgi:hypothetical protein